MTPLEHRVVIWAEAVSWAISHRQSMPAQRLMVLFIDAALSDGLLRVGERAAERLITWNPRHLLAEYDSAAAAFRDEDFLTFVSSVRRQHAFEDAEQLIERRTADDRLQFETGIGFSRDVFDWLDELPRTLS